METWIVVQISDSEKLEKKSKENGYQPSQEVVDNFAAQDKRILPLVDLADPAIDPDTETLQGFPHYDDWPVEETRVTRQRTKRDLTQDELDRTATDDQLRSWIPTFEAKTATSNQVQRVIEELLKRSVGGE